MLSAIRFRYSAASRLYDESRDLCLAALRRYVPKPQNLGLSLRVVRSFRVVVFVVVVVASNDTFRFRTSARRIIKDSMTSEK